MKPLRLLRRSPDTPTLRERAAALKAKAATLIRRPAKEADPQRRAMMTAGLAAAVAAPLPVLAAPSVMGAVADDNPDRAVFEAFARIERRREASKHASAAFAAAHEAFWRALGPYPAGLLVSRKEAAEFFGGLPSTPKALRGARLFEWVTSEQGGTEQAVQAWTAKGLRLAIQYAVPIFGPGGRTPFRIRRWRSLIPVAEAFEARHAALSALHRMEPLRAASMETARALTAAQTTLLDTPATTPEGLAVIVRHLADGDRWWERGPAWQCLIRGAATVAGVVLTGPDFDAEAWVSEWQAVGGRLERVIGREWGMIAPPLAGAPEVQRAELRRLEDGWHRYARFICRHLDAVRPA